MEYSCRFNPKLQKADLCTEKRAYLRVHEYTELYSPNIFSVTAISNGKKNIDFFIYSFVLFVPSREEIRSKGDLNRDSGNAMLKFKASLDNLGLLATMQLRIL